MNRKHFVAASTTGREISEMSSGADGAGEKKKNYRKVISRLSDVERRF